jgi:two-component system phosphate regulon response regulator PhoB
LTCGDLEIHKGRHEVFIKGKPLELTASEFKLLYLLARKSGWVFSRSQIVDSLRGPDYPVTERAIDVLVAGLRKKLGVFGKHIGTVRGVGYKFQTT